MKSIKEMLLGISFIMAGGLFVNLIGQFGVWLSGLGLVIVLFAFFKQGERIDNQELSDKEKPEDKE